VFGVPGELDFATPTRVVVRDVQLTGDSAKELETKARTDLPYTEIKTEVAIDRVTSKANPRQMERVPAGSVFGPAELVYSVYEGAGCDAANDVKNLRDVIEGLQLLEADYLGGLGSRGSGKVQLQNIQVTVRNNKDYLADPITLGPENGYPDLAKMAKALDDVMSKARKILGIT
jgi:CRISPR-associated protein Csm3